MSIELYRMLGEREAAGSPIVVGLIGAGQMGTDLITQLRIMPGMRLGAVSVRSNVATAHEAMLSSDYPEAEIERVDSAEAVDRAIEGGRVAITADLPALMNAERIEVVIDATGHPESGARVALSAIAARKHIVMLNVETDVTIGRYLHAAATKAGVVYTGAAGDEPAAAAELVAFARALGLKVLAAGKGKNNAFNHDAVPSMYEAEAVARNMNPRVLVEFVDGTKTAVEMVALANATGLRPDKPGMHGPDAGRDALATVFCLKEEGGLLDRKGVVDFTVGKGVAPGVFCVVEATHPRVLERMTDLHIGKGPFFTLLRPYHLTSLETPLTAARAVMLHQADIAPLPTPVAETCAVAKRDLRPGESLGRIGEADYRGWAMTWEDARAERALPLGLAERSVVIRDVRKGELLSYGNCRPDEALTIVRIRREMDRADDEAFPRPR